MIEMIDKSGTVVKVQKWDVAKMERRGFRRVDAVPVKPKRSYVPPTTKIDDDSE